jgi:hypothetical protein
MLNLTQIAINADFTAQPETCPQVATGLLHLAAGNSQQTVPAQGGGNAGLLGEFSSKLQVFIKELLCLKIIALPDGNIG